MPVSTVTLQFYSFSSSVSFVTHRTMPVSTSQASVLVRPRSLDGPGRPSPYAPTPARSALHSLAHWRPKGAVYRSRRHTHRSPAELRVCSCRQLRQSRLGG